MADTSLGWYVAADVGHGPISSQSIKVSDVTLSSAASTATPPLASGTYKLEPDYSARGFLRAGYRFTPNLRAELELGARPGKLIDGLGGSNAANLGSLDKTSIMANAIVDFWPDSGLHPFVGVGVGMVNAKADYRETTTLNGHSVVYSIDDSHMVPAGQFLAGATWDVTRHLHFDMTYRYLRTGSTHYDIAVLDTYGPSADPTTDSYTAHGAGPIEDHSLTIGLRWTFGAPLAPAAAPQTVAYQADAAPTVPPVPPAVTSTTASAAPAPTSVSAPVAPVTTTHIATAGPADSDLADVAGASDAADGSLAASTANRQHSGGKARPGVVQAGTKAGNSQAPSAPVTMAANDPASAPAPAVAVAQSSSTTSAPAAPVATQPTSSGTTADSDPSPLMTIPAPRRFTTYFPLGGSSLDSVAKSTVVDAAQYAKSAPAPRVTVDGYADTSGSAAYNLALSHRRATAVSNELQSNGIPTDAITVAWHGETHLAVKTGDGVRMAKNRRVTIGVSFTGAPKAHHRHWRRHHRHKKAG